MEQRAFIPIQPTKSQVLNTRVLNFYLPNAAQRNIEQGSTLSSAVKLNLIVYSDVDWLRLA